MSKLLLNQKLMWWVHRIHTAIQKKFKVEGKNKNEQKKLINNAKKIEEAGAFSIVLECVSKMTAKKITKLLKIPTIGIGSSNFCDSQILVTDDLLE